MKKFKFRLDAVLKYKKILKDKQLAQYNKALGAYKDIENKINDLEQQQEDVYNSMLQNAQDGFSLINHQSKEIVNQKIHHEMNVEKVRLAKRKKLVQVEQKNLLAMQKMKKG